MKNFVLTFYQAQQIASKKLSLTVSLSDMHAFYNYICISFCMVATVKPEALKTLHACTFLVPFNS